MYVGAIIAALFILGCFIVRGPLKWAMVAATVVAMVLGIAGTGTWRFGIACSQLALRAFCVAWFALGKRWYYALIGALAWGFSSYFVIIIGVCPQSLLTGSLLP